MWTLNEQKVHLFLIDHSLDLKIYSSKQNGKNASLGTRY